MKQFLFVCLGMALLAACHKDDDLIICPPLMTGTFTDLRAAAPAVQKFRFDLSQSQSILTRAGARVTFGPDAFVLPNGTVATGQAELRVREIYSVPDMILADMPTTAIPSRQMLISGGEFNIQVWQGSTRLRLLPRTATSTSASAINQLNLNSPVPTTGLDTTKMFVWKQLASPLAGTLSDSSGWQSALGPTTAGPASPIYIGPIRVASSTTTYSAFIPLDSIGNWNIDQFWHAYQTKLSSTIGIEVPTTTSGAVTRVYCRPVGFNGLARCYAAANAATRWNTLLPVGADVIAVVLQEQNGQFYYGTQRVTITAGLVVTPPLQALSTTEIIQRIRQL